MLFSVHVLSGAALARTVVKVARYDERSPKGKILIAGGVLGLGVLSHLALDSIPHIGDFDEKTFLKIAKVDGITALVIGALILKDEKPQHWVVSSLGMVGAGAPDFDKPAKYFFNKTIYPRWFNQLHGGIQTEGKKLWVTDATTASGLTLYLARTANR
jgi:hypothetical protein